MHGAERLDFELLLDRLEEAIGTGSRVPFSTRVMIDVQDCGTIIEQLRVALPDELDQARKVIAERDSILERARTEAEALVSDAQQRIGREAMNHDLVREARMRAGEIEHHAQENARKVREETDEYVRRILQRVTSRVEGTLRSLKTGMLELERGYDGGSAHSNGEAAETDEYIRPGSKRVRSLAHAPVDGLPEAGRQIE
jgi:ElaB/YqjD/DUF883 family membrane-anchored ribosome-binding protein